MLVAIGKFFSALLKILLGIATGLLNWARKHPRELVIVLVALALIIATAFGTHKWTKKQEAKVITALQEQVTLANSEAKKRDEKIKRIEDDSKINADRLIGELRDSKAKSDEIVSEYEARLREERKNYRIVYVKDKDGKETPVSIDKDGQVVCSRVSQTFFDSANKLVDNANKPLNREKK
jgi:ABC-type Na+ efflux pump permease subunit